MWCDSYEYNYKYRNKILIFLLLISREAYEYIAIWSIPCNVYNYYIKYIVLNCVHWIFFSGASMYVNFWSCSNILGKLMFTIFKVYSWDYYMVSSTIKGYGDPNVTYFALFGH